MNINFENKLMAHSHSKDYLLDLWRGGHFHPCWLIYGQRGIGKATLAYHAALDILSQSADNPHGMSRSIVLRQIEIGSYPNLFVLERQPKEEGGELANEITVDQVRNLRHYASLSAPISGWRVVIIDSADELNTAAANALLKLLEEPPAKTLFLLIAHNLGNVLPTIRSRCLRLPLTNLSADHLNETISSPVPELIEMSQGNLNLYKLLEELGGPKFCEDIKELVDKSAAGKFAEIQTKLAAIAKPLKNKVFDIVTLMQYMVFQKVQADANRREFWILVWGRLNQFLTVAKNTHLDTLHVLTSACLIIENPNSVDYQ